MKVQVLMSPGCEHGKRTVDLVAEVVPQHAPSAKVQTIVVATSGRGRTAVHPGSPTVRVDDVDAEPQAPTNVGLG